MLPLLLKLLSLAPSAVSLYKSVTSDDKPAVVDKLLEVASDAVKLVNPNVTDSRTLTVEEILQHTSAPAVQKAVTNALDTVAMEELSKRLADVQHARAHTNITDRPLMLAIAQHVMRFNILYCAILLLVQIGAIYLFTGNEVMVALIANLVGILASQLLTERSQVLNYYFGASVAPEPKSKSKEV